VNEQKPRKFELQIPVFPAALAVASWDGQRILPPMVGAQKREDMTMNNQTVKRALVVAIAATIALGAVTPSWSAPVLSTTTAVKAAAPSAVSDVRYRNRGYYRNDGAAVALGILGVAGAVAAGSAYRDNSYGYPGYYQQGYGGPYDGYARGPANYGYYNNY
jgi:peptidoglycan/LPS O-acetylase OafA/YrhL